MRALIQEANQPSGDDLLSGDLSLRREENDLVQIYKAADFVHNNLANQSKQWLKAKFQLMCAKSLLQEVQDMDRNSKDSGGPKSRMPPRERIKLLSDMLKPTSASILNYEEQWNGMIYDYGDKKNLLTSVNHQELLGLTFLRLKYLSSYVELCGQALDYEPIKEVYKKKLSAYKHQEQGNSGTFAATTANPEGGLDGKNVGQGSCGSMLQELVILF